VIEYPLLTVVLFVDDDVIRFDLIFDVGYFKFQIVVLSKVTYQHI